MLPSSLSLLSCPNAMFVLRDSVYRPRYGTPRPKTRNEAQEPRVETSVLPISWFAVMPDPPSPFPFLVDFVCFFLPISQSPLYFLANQPSSPQVRHRITRSEKQIRETRNRGVASVQGLSQVRTILCLHSAAGLSRSEAQKPYAGVALRRRSRDCSTEQKRQRAGHAG